MIREPLIKRRWLQPPALSPACRSSRKQSWDRARREPSVAMEQDSCQVFKPPRGDSAACKSALKEQSDVSTSQLARPPSICGNPLIQTSKKMGVLPNEET